MNKAKLNLTFEFGKGTSEIKTTVETNYGDVLVTNCEDAITLSSIAATTQALLDQFQDIFDFYSKQIVTDYESFMETKETKH